MNKFKGIILAGGAGTRLTPLTSIFSKHLLPVYDKPMIYYPLATLMAAGVTEFLIITNKTDLQAFERTCGCGRRWGISITYRTQSEPLGLAHALSLAADWIDGTFWFVLGDNLLFGNHLISEVLADKAPAGKSDFAHIFSCPVAKPQNYGVISIAPDGKILAIEEKPPVPQSNLAVIGVYRYPDFVFDMLRDVQISPRGEYEITCLNNLLLKRGVLMNHTLGRGFTWFDGGSAVDLLEASNFVQSVQARQGQIICSPDEIAFRQGLISERQLVRNFKFCSEEQTKALAVILEDGL